MELLSSVPSQAVPVAYSVPGIVLGAGDHFREHSPISVTGQVIGSLCREVFDNKEEGHSVLQEVQKRQSGVGEITDHG